MRDRLDLGERLNPREDERFELQIEGLCRPMVCAVAPLHSRSRLGLFNWPKVTCGHHRISPLTFSLQPSLWFSSPTCCASFDLFSLFTGTALVYRRRWSSVSSHHLLPYPAFTIHSLLAFTLLLSTIITESIIDRLQRQPHVPCPYSKACFHFKCI